MKDQFPIRTLCAAFDVSPSGYYAWLEGLAQPGPRAREDVLLVTQIRTIYQESRQTYGSPRIQHELAQRGQSHGRNRIARLMRVNNLWGRQKKRFRVRTTDSQHDQPIAPNRLAEAPPVQRPNQVWVGDITYVATDEGWLFLAGVLDLCSRKLVGWAMTDNLETDLVLAAWSMAHTHRQPAPGLLFHSDRGCQYASAAFRQVLAETQALPSMSRKANCYDNATMESFWSTLKLELIYRTHFHTRAQARAAIFDYIETFYNRRRSHSALNYLSPVDFENHLN